MYFRNEKNIGPDANRMSGFKHARGKYVTFLDDDDYYTDYKFFSKAVKIFEEHESDEIPIVMVYANAELVDTHTGKAFLWNIGNPGRVNGIDYILEKGYLKPPSMFTVLFKTDILRKASPENKMLLDTITHFEAALDGDGWLMSDIIKERRNTPCFSYGDISRNVA